MTLPSGTRLGPYEIVSPLGAGGMGEVYRARDSKLNREVAIKVLPPGVAQDAERLARFKREAQVLASLNHPNIAAIYGLDEAGDKLFLVLELVHGEELADRLKRGAIPLDETLGIARQIALALEEAHEKGIVHRDLKPANVKLTPDGKVKVLDFGLAKTYSADAAGNSGIDSGNSPTMTHAATMAGMILGTAAYMSPEQARGKSVDKRSDIWAFGVVLYEMLTGAQLFPGETVSDTLAAVLTRELDAKALPAVTPNAVRQLLRRCLERNPKNRLHDIADARIVLDELSRGETDGPGDVPAAAQTPALRRVLPWAIAALAVVAAIGIALRPQGAATPSIERPPTAFGILVPPATFLPSAESPLLDLSADGRTLIFVAAGAQTSSLYRRSLDRLAMARIEGSEGASHPLLSPDGRFIAFFSGGALRKIPAEGGTAVTVAEARAPRGASWVKDGSLVLSPLYNSGLWQVPATGGAPVAVTTLDADKGERSHRWPQVLPDGRTVIFTVGLTTSPGDYDGANLDAVRLDTGERRTVLQGARMARYTPAGYLVFQRGGALLAVRFDPEKFETVGDPFTIADGVGGETSSGAGHFSVSASGLLVYVPQASIPDERVLVLVDRTGHETELPIPAASFQHPRFSPDGRRLAYSVGSGAASDDDIYLFDLAVNRLQRLTFGQGHAAPLWSSDGKSIAFTQGRSGEIGLFAKSADGSGGITPLRRTSAIIMADAWLADGRHLVVTDSQGTIDLRVLDAADGGTVAPLVASETAAEYAAALSPDERYVAYTTTETGTSEVFVETYPPGRGKWQVSPAGGGTPVWAREGQELYFAVGDALMAVDVDTKDVFRAGSPRKLFTGPFLLSAPTRRNYDVGPDGRFVMVKPKLVSTTPRELVVLDGWDQQNPTRKAAR